MDQDTEAAKPVRLYHKTYLAMLRNAVGSELFRNFYIIQSDGTEIDAMNDGSDSCAFFVSSILTLFRKLNGIHGTVAATIRDLEESGWQQVTFESVQPGDVLIWEAQEFDGKPQEHIGFYVGDGRAVSTSWTEKKVVEHDAQFDSDRSVVYVFHSNTWQA